MGRINVVKDGQRVTNEKNKRFWVEMKEKLKGKRKKHRKKRKLERKGK